MTFLDMDGHGNMAIFDCYSNMHNMNTVIFMGI